MNMKFKFLAAMTLAMGLFSCSNDEGLDNTTPSGPGILGNAETYATIRIAMPGGGDAMGRAFEAPDPEKGNGVEEGTEIENVFNSVSLYFFDKHDATATCKGVLNMDKSLFTKSENKEDKTITYTTTQAQKVGIKGENMSVYAVVNGSVSGVNTGTKLVDFLAKTVKTSEAINTDYLQMSSRTPDELSLSAENNTIEKAANLVVEVDRIAAKISYQAKKNTQGKENQYSVTKEKEPTTEVATVTLTDYKLVNLRNDAYFFRKVAGENGKWLEAENFGNGKQNGTNYVIDPKFTMKTLDNANKEDFVDTWFGNDKAYTAGTEYKELPKSKDYTRLGYCMENTMTQNNQLNGYSTGVIFKAIYAPKTVYVLKNDKSGFKEEVYQSGDTFYRYENVIYKTEAEVREFFNLDESVVIDKYEGDGQNGAPCYYHYWIRHMDNNQPENMGIMEFAIVRNNAYKLAVESVSGLGEPTDKIIPNIPDETSKMYLNVKVTILPWVVRNNDNIIL